MSDRTPSSSVLLDARELAAMCSVSKPSIWRWLAEGRLPEPIRLTSQCLRWRRRTGDPATGVEDWIEAGCPSLTKQQPLDDSGA